jgi:hypothetical protein
MEKISGRAGRKEEEKVIGYILQQAARQRLLDASSIFNTQQERERGSLSLLLQSGSQTTDFVHAQKFHSPSMKPERGARLISHTTKENSNRQNNSTSVCRPTQTAHPPAPSQTLTEHKAANRPRGLISAGAGRGCAPERRWRRPVPLTRTHSRTACAFQNRRTRAAGEPKGKHSAHDGGVRVAALSKGENHVAERESGRLEALAGLPQRKQQVAGGAFNC